MTALHKLAQFLLLGNHTIQTKFGAYSYKSGVNEYRIQDSSFQCDVAGDKNDGSKIFIEIFVNHKCPSEKVEFFQTNKLHSLEIDLSNVDINIKSRDLLDLMLTMYSIQSIFFDPTQQNQSGNNVVKEVSILDRILAFAVIGGIVYGVLNLIFPNRSRPK